MTERERVSSERFTALLNEELRRSQEYREGMMFKGDREGYQFIAPGMGMLERQGLDKLIYGRVAARYTI